MSSLLSSKSTATLLQKNLLHRPALMASRTTLQHHHQRCFLSSNEEPQSSQSSQHSDVFPVYTHHVSKIVLQHLQDARAGWLVEQGLASGLQIKANGTFLLHFPSRSDGGDGGKIWTGYDANSRQHWLSAYKPHYHARFLLQQSTKAGHHLATTTTTANNNNNNNNNSDETGVSMEDQIRNTVDHMIRVMPPRIELDGANTDAASQRHK